MNLQQMNSFIIVPEISQVNLSDFIYNGKKPMPSMNIFMSRKKLSGDDAATTNQIRYLKTLCYTRDIDFPFESMQQTKGHLKKYEASRAIKELMAGNSIVFIYPTTPE